MSYEANIVQQRSDLRPFLVKSHSMQALESHPDIIPPIRSKMFILEAARFECPRSSASIDRYEQTVTIYSYAQNLNGILGGLRNDGGLRNHGALTG